MITQGTTEVHYPSIPLCKNDQQQGDTIRYFDHKAGVERMTTYRAHLSLRTPWMPWTELLVFEDRVFEGVQRLEDLVQLICRDPRAF